MRNSFLHCAKSKRGSALIMVLFVIIVLSIFVGSFGFQAHLEAKYLRYLRDRQKCTFLAQSGITLAEMLMYKQRETSPQDNGTVDEDDRWHEAAKRLAQGLSIEGLIEPLGDGFIYLDIVPEPGRINVNKLNEADWERLLSSIGVPEEYWEDIIDPILDWIDADDNVRTKGAETTDYYAELDPPYKAKNGPVDTVRELLLVKGFSETLLTGGVFDPESLRDKTEKVTRFTNRVSRFSDTNEVQIAGLENMLTTYGDGKINIQSAPYEVLRTLPDVDDILARAIMEEREALIDDEPDPFTSVEDVFSRIDGLNSEISQMITLNSQYYRITATGRVNNVEKRIWCIATLSDGKLRYLTWCEEP